MFKDNDKDKDKDNHDNDNNFIGGKVEVPPAGFRAHFPFCFTPCPQVRDVKSPIPPLPHNSIPEKLISVPGRQL